MAIDNDLNALFVCKYCKWRGGITIFNEKYEVLFDSGTAFYLSGFYREAIFNWTTALERVIEAFVKYVIQYKLPEDQRQNEYNSYWGIVKKQSERQLGAFAAIYISEFGEFPDILHQKQLDTGLRNRVVHSGYIPNEDETFKYGEQIYKVIVKMLIKLYSKIEKEYVSLSSPFDTEKTEKKNNAIMSLGANQDGTYTDTAINKSFLLSYFAFITRTDNWISFDSLPKDISLKDQVHNYKVDRAKLDTSLSFRVRIDILKNEILETYGILSIDEYS